MFEPPDDEIYLGMGVHGGPGNGRTRVGPLRDFVHLMLGKLLEDYPMASGDQADDIINGMAASQ